MRVLHIINNLGSGGAEKLLEQSLPYMNNKEDISIEVLLLTDKNNVFEKKLIDNDIKIRIIPLRNRYSPLNIYYIRKYIVDGKYDIVHAHIFPSLYWTSIVSKLLFKNKPLFILTEHSTHNSRREKLYLRVIEKIIYMSYDKIISISKETQQNLLSWLNLHKKYFYKFKIIENGINVNKFYEAKPYKKSDIYNESTNKTKFICMVGKFSKTKDQKTLIKSMKYLSEDVHLLLIGEGPLINENKKYTNSFGLENRVHFLGFRNDVEKIIKTSDIIVLSSNWEGFGLAAVEGMAAGKPVIASNVPGLRDIVNGSGMIFKLGDSKELSNIINKLLNNTNNYKEVSRLCFNKSRMFNIERMCQDYLTLYQDLLDNRK